jgi:hypothetical protein
VAKAHNERFLIDARDWSIIPAENVIAAASAGTEILFFAESCQHMSSLLGALEAGVHGVVLRSDDLGQVRCLAVHGRGSSEGTGECLEHSGGGIGHPLCGGAFLRLLCSACPAAHSNVCVGTFDAKIAQTQGNLYQPQFN